MRRKQLIAEAHGGNPTAFITLTSKRKEGQTADQAAVALAHAWRRVRRRIMQQQGISKFAFLAVFEKTKLGWPHLHILARIGWVDQAWLSKQMDAEIGAPIVDIRRVDGTGRIAAYVAKYIGKDPTRFDGCKRYWKSQDWDQRPEFERPTTTTWTTRRISLIEWEQEQRVAGFWIERVSETESIAIRGAHPKGRGGP